MAFVRFSQSQISMVDQKKEVKKERRKEKVTWFSNVFGSVRET